MSERRLEHAIVCCSVGLLLWACYDYGAFLRPGKTVAAVAAPVLGLLWFGARGAVRSRAAMGNQAVRGNRPARAGVAAAYAGRTAEVRRSLTGPLLAALAIFGALSALWSLDWAGSLRTSGILFGGCSYLYVGRCVGASPDGRRRLLWLVGGAGVVMALLSVTGYAFRWSRFSLVKDGMLAATGTFGYANALAAMLLLTLAATVALGLDTRSRRRRSSIGTTEPGRFGLPISTSKTVGRLTLTAAIGIQAAALVLTWSKGAVAAVGVTMMLWLIARAFRASDHTRRHAWLGVILVVLLLAALAVGGFWLWRDIAPQMAVSGLPPSDADPADVVPMTSNAFRVKTWSAALEAARERPAIGWGLDTFYEAYSPYKLGGHTAYAHNVVIQHLVEVGGIGTALLLAFLLAATLRPSRTLLGPRGDPRIPLLLGVQAFALHNLIDLTWYFPALFFIFALLLGLAVSPSAPVGALSCSQSDNPSSARLTTDRVLCCRRPLE